MRTEDEGGGEGAGGVAAERFARSWWRQRLNVQGCGCGGVLITKLKARSIASLAEKKWGFLRWFIFCTRSNLALTPDLTPDRRRRPLLLVLTGDLCASIAAKNTLESENSACLQSVGNIRKGSFLQLVRFFHPPHPAPVRSTPTAAN